MKETSIEPKLEHAIPKYAVVLFNLGGPDSGESVEPFLNNIFRDPDIFKLPFGQNFFAKCLTKCRVKKTRNKYNQIGGESPINKWTERQRSMLQEKLRAIIANIDVFSAMRYWHPLISDVAEKVMDNHFNKIVLLPLYPHYSITTTGSSFNEWKRSYTGHASNLIYITEYYDHPKYISALNERIDEAVTQFPKDKQAEIEMLFSAHGTPENLAKKGDPYSVQIKKTVELVMEARHVSHKFHLCYQSRVGPLKWLGPSTIEVIETLGRKNKKQLLIIPISFISDQIETLHELEIEYGLIAKKNGVENYIVMQGLNDSEMFISALKDITINALEWGYS